MDNAPDPAAVIVAKEAIKWAKLCDTKDEIVQALELMLVTVETVNAALDAAGVPTHDGKEHQADRQDKV